MSVHYVTALTSNLNLLAFGSYYYRDRFEDLGGTGAVSGVLQLVDLNLGIESPGDWEAVLFVKDANDEKEINDPRARLFTINFPREVGLRVKNHF